MARSGVEAPSWDTRADGEPIAEPRSEPPSGEHILDSSSSEPRRQFKHRLLPLTVKNECLQRLHLSFDLELPLLSDLDLRPRQPGQITLAPLAE